MAGVWTESNQVFCESFATKVQKSLAAQELFFVFTTILALKNFSGNLRLCMLPLLKLNKKFVNSNIVIYFSHCITASNYKIFEFVSLFSIELINSYVICFEE